MARTRFVWRTLSKACLPALRVAAAGLAAAMTAAAITFAPLAHSQSKPPKPPDTYTQDDLRRVEAARDEALKRLRALQTRSTRADREAADIDFDLLAAAADSRRREVAADAAELRLVDLDRDVAKARAKLLNDEKSLDDLLAALMTFGSRKPPALAASPDDTASAVRAAILMSDAAPALAARAKALTVQIETLNALQAGVRRERQTLTGAEKALAARAEEISALAAEKRIARTSLAAETAALTAETVRLAGEADTLRDLLASLAASAPDRPRVKPTPGAKAAPGSQPRPAPDMTAAIAPGSASGTASTPAAPRPAPPAAGRPLPPAIGKIARRFGQTQGGAASAGLAWTTRTGAQVIAPVDARVEYAGVFRSYGQMLILDVGGDMLVIVAGLDALYPEAGQWVLAGEPVGRMSDQKSPSPELYLEVRRNGQPVDPQTWLGGA